MNTHPGNTPSDRRGFEEKIDRELMRMYYAARIRAMVAFAGSAVLLAWVFTRVSESMLSWHMELWLGLIAVATVFGISLGFIYRRGSSGREDAPLWNRLALATSTLSGIAFGLAEILLAPQNLQQHLIIAFFIAAISTFGLLTATTNVKAYSAFTLTVGLTFAASAFLTAPEMTPLAALMLVGMTAHLLSGRAIHRGMRETYRLRFENIDLVEQLKIEKGIAESANRAKTRFLAAASHDLRQPLHALTLFVSHLQQSITYPPVKHTVDNMEVAVEAMEGLFGALLDISKLEAGAVQPDIKGFLLQPLLDRLRVEHFGSAAKKRVELRCVPCSAVVKSDPALLERIVGNLIANAVRYTDSGRILVGCRRLPGRLAIQVWDTGLGIPEDKQQAIFQEFYQLENRDRKQGLGLGLAIVDRTARLLGYPLSLRSTPGKGSVFSIEVPLGRPEDIPQEMQPAEPLGNELSGKTILVVDDEPAIRTAMEELLTGWGCLVLTAESSPEALDHLTHAHARPDLIISDCHLGGGEYGIEAIRRLREAAGWSIPAMLVSGDTSPELLRTAQENGLRMLSKPVRPAKLRTLATFVLTHGSELR